jgi:acetate kinase
LDVPYEKQRIITCHIGNGASIAAIKDGRSIDTSMGMTPVEGLLMGTRSGDVDAGVITYIMEKENVGSQAISTIVNKYSGVLGVSGISSDMREIETAIQNGDERAILALKMYNYRIKKYVGAYIAALGGVDLLVFTGGVGENQWQTRASVCENMESLGIRLDKEKNRSVRSIEAIISADDSPVKVVVIPTDEEFMIALDTLKSIR